MKTKFMLKVLIIVAVIFTAYIAFSSLEGNAKTADCSLTFCVTDGSGNPASGHQLQFYYNGSLIGSCTTGRDGCCSPDISFADGKTYCVCDLGDPCTHNCTTFTVNCATIPTINIGPCGGDCQ